MLTPEAAVCSLPPDSSKPLSLVSWNASRAVKATSTTMTSSKNIDTVIMKIPALLARVLDLPKGLGDELAPKGS